MGWGLSKAKTWLAGLDRRSALLPANLDGDFAGRLTQQGLFWLLLLATALIYALELTRTIATGRGLIHLYGVPFIAGIALLRPRFQALLAGVLIAIGAINVSIGTDVVGSDATAQLLTQGLAIALCLWVNSCIAQQRQVSQSLQRALEASRKSAALLHEIKQPLMALQWQTRQLQLRNEQQHLKDVVLLNQIDALHASASELGAITQALWRLQRGTSPTTLAPLDLAPLLRQCLEPLGPRLRQSRIAVEIHGLEQPRWLLGDAVQLQILINNLLSNAIEALETQRQGARRLALTLRSVQANRWISLTVCDSGKGFAGQSLAKLQGRSTKPQGLGLGLFIAASIASNHQGALKLERCSDLGGACVALSLPGGRPGLHGTSAATQPVAPVPDH